MPTKKTTAKKTTAKKSTAKKTATKAAASQEQEGFRANAENAGRTVAARALEAQKRVLDFQRSAAEGVFNAVNSMQERQEDTVTSWLEGSERIPEAFQKFSENWIWAARTRRGTYQQAVDKSFQIAEDYVETLHDRVSAAS